jgi:hypothetical protein
MSRFIQQDFEEEVYINVVSKIFPNLNEAHKKILLKYLTRLLDIVVYCVFTDYLNNNIDKIKKQLRENNYRDIIGLMYMLLPYINDNSDKSTIKSINDIYVNKKNNVDISKQSPKYTFSNFQYGIVDNNYIEEQWSEEHMKNNFFIIADNIRLSGYKLCPNWVNIFPISMNTYKNTIYYKYFSSNKWTDLIYFHDFRSYIDPDNNFKHENDLKITTQLIQTEDIYDIISNYFYHNVKKIKWLIYDILTQLNSVCPLIILVNSRMNNSVDFCLNYTWKELPEENKKLFTSNWSNFIRNYKSSGQQLLNNESEFTILKSIGLFFSNHYSKIKNMDKSFVPLTLSDKNKTLEFMDDEIEEFDLEKNITDMNNVKKTLNSIKVQHIYNFFRESLQVLKHTIYGYRLIKFNKTKFELIDHTDEMFFVAQSSIKITLKNLYNFSKSLVCNNIDGKFVPMAKYAISLDDVSKNNFINKLKSTDGKLPDEKYKWFNISNNLRRIYRNQNININKLNNLIFNRLILNLITYIFEQLCYSGTFTRFIFNSFVTDTNNFKNLSESDTKQKFEDEFKKISFKNTSKTGELHNTYHYLTCQLHTDMKLCVKSKKFKGTYPEYNSKKEFRFWFKEYAFNWISQLNFFCKYRNCRAIFVTGSTGVGKSTLIPLLFLYALKAVDYNLIGKIANTQPRTGPTTKNASILASQMGVPILKKDSEDICSDIQMGVNYNIQYSTQKEKYLSNESQLTLKVLTDGSLWNTISSNVLLKSMYKTGDIDVFSKYNIYDIIMIDEAHEHNKNMDLILTLSRYTAYYNNSVKIVIISATMDDDEPIYRRYYKCLDDNLMYPFNVDYNKNGINRLLMDRRIHVSPPGETTRFKITEEYKDSLIPNYNENEIIKIAKSTTSGDILYFQPGYAEIIKSLNYLQNTVPENMVVLPFYSKLPDKKKNILLDLQENLGKIKIGKKISFNSDAIFDPLNPPENMQEKTPFTRALLIATDIAEASITFPDLKYVFDTGNRKTNMYDFRYDTDILKTELISESSRLQRKGRVGRTSSGNVVYFYKKGTTENNKISYGISRENINSTLYKLLYEKSTDTVYFDGTNISDTNNIYIKDLIDSQYTFVQNMKHELITNLSIKQKTPCILQHTIYKSGFDLNTLIDADGSFYIIHPEERSIIRNITGKITGTKIINNIDTKITPIYINNTIRSQKLEAFSELLDSTLSIVHLSTTDMRKTTFGKIVQSLLEFFPSDFGFDDKICRSFVYSLGYGVESTMIKFMAILPAFSTGKFYNSILTGTLSDGYFKLNISDFTRIYPKTNSDFVTIIQILNNFHNYLKIKKIYLEIKNEYENSPSEFISKYNFLLIKNKITISTNDTFENNFRDIFEDSDGGENNFISDWNKLKLSSISDLIKQWCNNNFIKFDIIYKYVERYIKLNQQILSLEMQIDNMDSEDFAKIDYQEIIKVSKSIVDLSVKDSDKLLVSLLQGFNTNIFVRVNSTPYYLSIRYPDIEFTPHILTLGKSETSNLLDTNVNSMYLSNYILALNYDTESNGVSLISEIKPHLFKYVGMAYNPQYIKNKLDSLISSQIVLTGIEKSMKQNIIANYRSTLINIKRDIEKYYDKYIGDKYIKNLGGTNNLIMSGGGHNMILSQNISSELCSYYDYLNKKMKF